MTTAVERHLPPAAGPLVGRGPDGAAGLVVFLNAGDPPGPELDQVLQLCDRYRVDAVELAVPFPDSPTDGPTIRESADRALAQSYCLDRTLADVERIKPNLRHTRIVLLADWAHTVRPVGLSEFLVQSRRAGADAVLLHGVPPRMSDEYHRAARREGVPVVATCYHGRSTEETLRRAAEQATAYVYLVAAYGRSGTATPVDAASLSGSVARLQSAGTAPVAIGFGVKTRADVARVSAAGAQAAIVGSAFVSAIVAGRRAGDVTAPVQRLLDELTAPHPPIT